MGPASTILVYNYKGLNMPIIVGVTGREKDNSSRRCFSDECHKWLEHNPDDYCLRGYIKCSSHQPVCAKPCDGVIECEDGLDESHEDMG